jgi:shikimate dehydrogenase
MPQITGTTKLLGVIGNPIAHSLSPVIHNAAIEHLDLDYCYVPFLVKPAHLATALDGFASIGVVGCSVTIPHKQAIIHRLVNTTPLARAIGAVNTIWHTPAGWQGTNTDVAGFVSPLMAMERDWGKTTAIVLGNGGAARAVVAGCHQLGCGKIQVFGRDLTKLTEFRSSWQEIQLRVTNCNTPTSVILSTHLWDELPTFIDREQLLIVNCTPIGMHPPLDASPIDPEIFGKVGANAIAYDLIYAPRPTKFLQLATERGLSTIDGTEMLVHQGAMAFELWLQQPAPVAIMHQALLAHLAARS